VFLQGGVGEEKFEGVEFFGEMHFVVEFVDGAVARAANINATVEFSAGVVFAVIRPSVNLAGDQVVEGERLLTAAERAGIYH